MAIAAVAVGGGLTACGGSGHSASGTSHAARPSPSRGARPSPSRAARPSPSRGGAATATAPVVHAVNYSDERDALVTMRAYSPASLLWQTVSLTPDGRGLLTSLIGEISGARRTPFHLTAAQTVRLRRLVAAGRHVRPLPGTNGHAMLYTLHIRGRPAANLEGAIPPRLAPLIRFLSGLMLSYCC